MPRAPRKTQATSRRPLRTKYDAHHVVLEKTYGALADLRRELADSRTTVAERAELLELFANCTDSQRAWLLLEDYFEKLSLSRRDFGGTDWWPRLLESRGKDRLEKTALIFLRAQRPLPTELIPHANLERFAQLEQAEREHRFVQQLEQWLLPPAPTHLDGPRAALKLSARLVSLDSQPGLFALAIDLILQRPRTGERRRTLAEVVDLTNRSGHEQELFSPEDWQIVQWLARNYPAPAPTTQITLTGRELLEWLICWSNRRRLGFGDSTLEFRGEPAELTPHLETWDGELCFTHRLSLPEGPEIALADARFFAGLPALVLVGQSFYVLRNDPPEELRAHWAQRPELPVQKLSHRLLTHLRKCNNGHGDSWDRLCITHSARPRFLFELADDTVRLRLCALSERDESPWFWNGHEWQLESPRTVRSEKPEILDDPRLDAAVHWLRRLDWFTPEPGVWIGDANESFLYALASAWPARPAQAEYLGNPSFQRLFLAPRPLRPRVVLHGSGIDWLSVSAAWEHEGLQLTPADLERLQTASGRFVKLPDGGWMELDHAAVQSAQETLADLGLGELPTTPQKIALIHAAQIDETALQKFGDTAETRLLRTRLENFSGITPTPLPAGICADLRPYQREGFNFLCHLTRLKLGGVLADDMGLGKTLQTLIWLAWLRTLPPKKPKSALVICPASVLHNWRREANRFTPQLRVLVLESGSARHNLRRQIPQHDLIVTNYALLRRDLEALQKFDFSAIVLDEAQFIKNPGAQITQSVKQLKADHRLALTGTPLENRLLDLWSIVDFVQPAYLGNQAAFQDRYEPRGSDADFDHKIARRRLSAKLRPLLLRRLKRQVAQDLPDRIEERRDCELGESQRKLYLAELRRSRDEVLRAVAEKGVSRSKIHVLAALTRLRQICCHPQLVGNDATSGKTDTLFELLEPLMEDGQKVLLFSQFVRMLQILEEECRHRAIPTHILTGDTKDRAQTVAAFQKDERAAVFLLSLRAAGTGLNLTSASYVVLYDPWWNPAVEAQAIDRSHRIGQTQTVNAYRFIAPGTVEEKIWELQQRKAQTISDVLGEEGFARSLSRSDLEYLFSEDLA